MRSCPFLNRTANQTGELPRRWVVECSFGRMVRWRRLVRDYEAGIDVSEGVIYVAMGSRRLRGITTQKCWSASSKHRMLDCMRQIDTSSAFRIRQMGHPRTAQLVVGGRK